jgi:hypothetical protein
MSKLKPETFERARTEIMHYVLSFCVANRMDDAEYPRVWATEGFYSRRAERPVQVGDLVLLASAPASKWQIGWLREIGEEGAGWPRYLIESLEDQSLCWWGNVDLRFFPRDKMQAGWRWSDRQFAFKDRWFRACYKIRDAYIVRPLFPVFGEGYSVTLGTRTSHGFDDIQPKREFLDWRKVTIAQMLACYDDCVAERARIQDELKAAAPSPSAGS